MSKPGITNNGGLPWKKIIGGGAVAAVVGTALALSQCDGNQENPPVAPATDAPSSDGKINGWVANSWTYRYTASENLPLLESASPGAATVAFLKKGSCVEALPGADGYASRSSNRMFAEVSAATGENGAGMRKGWMALRTLSDHGSFSMHGRGPSGSCTAEFITSAAGAEQQSVPAQLLSISGSANFYRTPDETSPIAGVSGDASCVKTTGNKRGNMIEVHINDDQKPYWAVETNFRPAPSHVTAQTCNAKFEPSL